MTSFKRIIMFLFVFIFSLLLNGHGAQAAENSVGSDKGEDGQYFDISVAVKWDDCTNKDGIRPDRISVRLYANGAETGDGWSNEELETYIANHDIKCPVCGKKDFTGIRQFNLMFKTFQGVNESSASELYLRPETA